VNATLPRDFYKVSSKLVEYLKSAMSNVMSVDEFQQKKKDLLKELPNSSSYLNKEVFPLDTL
jgi:hypothetical protein